MSNAEPIKVGFLIDYIGDSSSMDDHSIYLRSLELVFDAGYESGMIDRPVEVVFRMVQGLPRGNVKAVIDAFGELVDEGCLAVIGPHISDNTVVVRPEIERRFRVPAISVCGSEHWLGEWTFLLNNGSMTDEPILWANLMARAEQPTAGVLVERSYIGKEYLANFRRAALLEGVQIVAEEPIAQTGQDISAAVAALHEAGASAIVHCGFGLGVAEINDALRALDWDPAATWAPRSRRASTSTCGTRTSDGSGSSNTTRATPSGSGSSTSTKRPTASGPSTTARCCGVTARCRSSPRSPTPRRCRRWASRTRSSG